MLKVRPQVCRACLYSLQTRSVLSRQVRSSQIISTPLLLGSRGRVASPFSGQQGSQKKQLTQQRLNSAAVQAMAGGAKKVLVPVANGSEEIEAVVIIDVLRRAGAEVTVASVEDSLQVECSRKVKLVADVSIEDVADQQFDAIALPGGMPGAERLRDSKPLQQLLAKQAESGRVLSAICASPAVVFEAQGLLAGKKATAHPAFVDKLSDSSSAATRVVVDGQLITSRGPGTSFEFALQLVSTLLGEEKAKEVAGPMVMAQH